MNQFDHLIRSADDSFDYSRYVDDIIIITSAREKKAEFVTWIKNSLPPGLSLNPNKREIAEVLNKVEKIKGSCALPILSFDYLGYAFTVSNPTTQEAGNKKNSELNRTVFIDIASRKIKKFKTRIVRAFLDFSKTGDWNLLRDRTAYLTQNFSVYNAKAGGKKLAGIYHSYPLVILLQYIQSGLSSDLIDRIKKINKNSELTGDYYIDITNFNIDLTEYILLGAISGEKDDKNMLKILIDSFVKIWKISGSLNHIRGEIEQLEMLEEFLTEKKKKRFILNLIDKLKVI